MNENTFLEILDRMKAAIRTEADRREGTWTADNLQAVANELARIYSEEIEPILPQAFVATATGRYLDLACGDYGITRREETCAEVLLEVTGETGAYESVLAYAGDVVFQIPAPFWLTEGVPQQILAVCTLPGEIGNVPAGGIDRASTSRISRITNPEDAYGGYDTESDDSLRARALERIRTPASSGNIAHYMQWAKEVPGVAKVQVYDLPRGNGTVDVVIIADGNTTAPKKLLEDVAAHIEEVRPIGADVQVLAAEEVKIQVTCSVITQAGYAQEGVQEELSGILQDYFESVAFRGQIVSYLGIVNMIFSCAGVIDVEECTINGETHSLQLQTRQFPSAGETVVTVREMDAG